MMHTYHQVTSADVIAFPRTGVAQAITHFYDLEEALLRQTNYVGNYY